MKKIKLLTIILIIVLICLVGFVGVYVHAPNRIDNKVKEYSFTGNLKGKRVVLLKVDEEETNKEEEFLTAKEIIEKRLKYYGATDYTIGLDKKTGTIKIELAEDENTEYYIYKITQSSKFELATEDGTVLLNNEAIKSVKANYEYLDDGYQAYIEVKVNKDAKDKLAEISEKYAVTATQIEEVEANKTGEESTEETTEETTTEETTTETEETAESTNTKEIATLKISDTEYDIEKIEKDKIQILVGSATTSESSIESYLENAYDLKGLLESGYNNISYDESDEYISSTVSKEDIQISIIVLSIMVVISLVVLVIIFKVNGSLSAFSFVGQIALLLLIIRYTNVVLTIEGLLAIVMFIILNYILIFKILRKIKQKSSIKEAFNQTYKEFFISIIPIYVVAIVSCFTGWTNLISFGTVMFWGILVIAIFNIMLTKSMIKIKASK